MPSASRIDSDYRFALSDYGPDLSGRSLGELIRGAALDLASDKVVFDCNGVDTISPSFADEAFGLLAIAPERPRIEVINASPDIIAAIRFAVGQRAAAVS
jgi:STAS-like domain of unknown function (DUF4325)